ncbi:HtaA domain-containing protein [Streptomyces roseifaciens]
MTANSRRAALAALATATALGAMTLTVPAHAATADAPQTTTGGAGRYELQDGTLEWGVKKKFRDYVSGDGKIEVADGVQRAEGSGAFVFGSGVGTFDPAAKAVSTTFKGKVHFFAHPDEKKEKWGLDFELADVKLTTRTANGGKADVITADVTSGGTTQDDVVIASADLSKHEVANGALVFAGIPVKLTEQGSKVLGYKAGTELDPATLKVKYKYVPGQGQGQQSGGQAGGATGGGASTGATGGGTSTGTSGGSTSGTTGGTSTGSTGGASTGTTTGTTGDTTGTGTQKPKGELYDGNLDWGLRKSFRDYITDGFGAGKIEVTGPATKTGAGFRFPKGEGKFDEAGSTLKAAFKGQVRFTGHEGELDLTFGKFELEASGKTGKLSAEVVSKADGAKPKTVQLADLTLTDGVPKAKDGVVHLQGVGAKLTEDGAKVFSYKGRNFYKAGSDLDPVTAAVAVEANAKLPEPPAGTGTGSGSQGSGSGSSGSGAGSTGGSTGGSTTGGAGTTGGGSTTGGSLNTASLASTGAGTPTAPLLGAAGALVLAGSGAVFAARRRGRGAAQV